MATITKEPTPNCCSPSSCLSVITEKLSGCSPCSLPRSYKIGIAAALVTFSLLGITAAVITLSANKISKLRTQALEAKIQANNVLTAHPDIMYLEDVTSLRDTYFGWSEIRVRQGLSASWDAFMMEGNTPLYELRQYWRAVTTPSYDIFRGTWGTSITMVPDARYVCVWRGLDVNTTLAKIAGKHGRSFADVFNVCTDGAAYSRLYNLLNPTHTVYKNFLRNSSDAISKAVAVGFFGIGCMGVVGAAGSIGTVVVGAHLINNDELSD